MDYKELKNKIIDNVSVVDNAPVIFRTPENSAYTKIDCHVTKLCNVETVIVDLMNISPTHGSDYDLDSSRPPVEDGISTASVILPKDFAKSYVINYTDQDLYIADRMNSILKAMHINCTRLSFFVDKSIIEPFTLGCLFRKKGYEVDIVIEDDCEAKMTIKW